MNKILWLTILACALCLAPYSASAQSARKKSGKKAKATTSAKKTEAKLPDMAGGEAVVAEPAKADDPSDKKTDDKKSDDNQSDKKSDDKKNDKKDDKDANPMGGGLSFGGSGGDLPIKLARFLRLDSDPNGLTVLNGQVYIETMDGMKITCDILKIDNKSNLMTGTGNPVKLDGAGSLSQCRNLTYDLKTKSALMENEALVIQDKNGQKTRTGPADTIKIDYPTDSSGKVANNAQPKISIFNRQDHGVVELRVTTNEAKAENKSKSGGPKKVNDANLIDIKVPSSSKSPGVDQ